MICKIVQSGEKKLRQISKPVRSFDRKILNLIQDLRDTLEIQNDPEGVGLAAPQIGVNLQVFAVKYKDFKRIVVNPEIVAISEKRIAYSENKKNKNEILEGCLSLPHYYGPLKREDYVKLKYQTLSTVDGSPTTVIEEFKDFNAQIILHEIDHLNGILFVDRLLEQKKKLYKLDENDEWEEVDI